MSVFTHLILTAFNIPISGSPGLDPEWLRHRFELFERFCLPSVREQTNQQFKWLVYLDPATPEPYKNRFKEMTDLPQIRPVFVTNLDQCVPAAMEEIDARSSHLITTTLDNDDALARDFVDTVQRSFAGQPFEFLEFPGGYRLDMIRRKLYFHTIISNPFLSLIERIEEESVQPRTIRGCGPHHSIRRRYDSVRSIATEPMWLQVLHERNIAATGVWGCRRIRRSDLNHRFDVSLPSSWTGDGAAGESYLSIGMENVRRSLERVCIHGIPPRLRRSLRRLLKRT